MTEQELKRQTEREIRWRIGFRLLPWMLLILIICIGLLKDCIRSRDPIDDSINRSQEVVRHLEVCDTTRNGFRVVYVTNDAVTVQRLNEIRLRQPLNRAFCKLKDSAAFYFGGSLLQTDIYDFAAYARQFDVDDDVRMQNIFIFGSEKQKLYVGKNPRIENSATWINPATEQGVQYINADDIYFRVGKSERVYRYWKCHGNHSTSTTDERFSHFSEDERLW